MSSVVRPGRKEEREESVNQRAGHVTVAHRGRTLVWGGYMENQVGQCTDGCMSVARPLQRGTRYC